MQWIKEVEMVDSVDDLKSSSSTRGIPIPKFEVLDARIASALNRNIHNAHFKRRISLEEQQGPRSRTVSFAEDRLLTWFTNTSGSLGAMILSENYTDLFTIVLRNDDFQEFDSKWGGIFSMTKIPPDDILEGLYKLRIRESEKLKTVLELYDLEIHQKKLKPDYHRLKTMVKRSIEQDIRKNNCGARSGKLWKKRRGQEIKGTKQRVQRILGDCWQRESNGQCSRRDNFSFRHDVNLKTHFLMPVKRWMIFGSMSGSFIYRHHVEPRVKLCSPQRGIIPYSTEVHWRFQNYSYKFGCQTRETHRWLLENRWV